MIQLNLLPDVKKEYLRAQSFRAKTISFSILVTVVAIGLTAVLASYVYGAQLLISSAQKNDIAEKSQQLKSKSDIGKYLTIQNQLSAISGLHDEKTVTSRILGILPQLNPAPPNNVLLANIKLSVVDGQLVFQGGVRDYSALTTFKNTLENAKLHHQADGQEVIEKLFKEVNVIQASYSGTEPPETALGFTVQTAYNPNLLVSTLEGYRITVPNMETTQSVVASPKLFQENAGAPNGQQ